MAGTTVAALIVAALALGQDGDRILPLNYTVPGGAEAVARRAFLYQQAVIAQQRRCDVRGCLVIVNDTANYDVTGFFLVTGERAGETMWTPNQFLRPLTPRAAAYTVKAGDDSMCALPVRFELLGRETGERLVMETQAALCRRHRASTVLRIRVEVPKVTVEEGD